VVTGDTASDSFDAAFFDQLFELENRHYWFRARNDVITAVMRQHIVAAGEKAHVLEIGCGNCNVLSHLSRNMGEKTWIGGDLFIEGLLRSRERVNLPVVQLDAYSLPFETSLDAVCMFDVLEHLRDDAEILAEAYRVLKPGGKIVVTVPAYQGLWSYFDEASHHQRRYSRAQLRQKLTEPGFKIDMISYYMATLLPLVFLQRKVQTCIRNGTANGAKNDFRVIPPVNDLLYVACSAEKTLVSRVGLPFGASLIAVGCRPDDDCSKG
jgi:SAM-dependent methyltransferase